MNETMAPAKAGTGVGVAGILAALIGLGLGVLVLEAVNAGIDVIWMTVPESLGSALPAYVLGVLAAAAVLVFVVRRYVGDEGHSPIGGIAVSSLTPRAYVGVILAIVASLWGGIVLGPEVALVATGSMVGTVAARVARVSDTAAVAKVVGLGALGAVLALFVLPLLTGSMAMPDAPQTIEVDQLAWAVPLALIATVAVALARMAAALIARAAGTSAHLLILVGSAVTIAICAIAFEAITGESVTYVVTSGEELITDLPSITSVATLVAIIVLKTVAYALSLGSGFRGGPFFPVMFIGAALGLLASLVLPGGPDAQAAIIVGVVAAVIATAPMRWPIAIAIGAAIGFIMGSWAVVPAAIIAAIVARAIPRWGDAVARTAAAPSHDVNS